MAALSSVSFSSFSEDIRGINWVSLKSSDYRQWRSTLYGVTQKVLLLAANEFKDLSELNEVGIYHKIPSKHAGSFIKQYEETGKVPSKWVSQGQFPGVWCALFNPHNTYSMASDLSLLQITFKAEYKIFDVKNEEHLKMWSAWSRAAENISKVNSWKSALNGHGSSLADRMSCGLGIPGIMVLSPPMPGHSEFYREHKFGAVVGYSDYMALTVIDPECIETLRVVERS
jgi:hypothetical protein